MSKGHSRNEARKAVSTIVRTRRWIETEPWNGDVYNDSLYGYWIMENLWAT